MTSDHTGLLPCILLFRVALVEAVKRIASLRDGFEALWSAG